MYLLDDIKLLYIIDNYVTICLKIHVCDNRRCFFVIWLFSNYNSCFMLIFFCYYAILHIVLNICCFVCAPISYVAIVIPQYSLLYLAVISRLWALFAIYATALCFAILTFWKAIHIQIWLMKLVLRNEYRLITTNHTTYKYNVLRYKYINRM